MPCPTDQQLAADALHQAFLVNIVVEAEANLHEDGSDSESHASQLVRLCLK